MNSYRLGIVYSFVTTMAGALFVGFTSCGGFAWHRTALNIHTLVAGLLLLVLLRLQARHEGAEWFRGGLLCSGTLAVVWYGGQAFGFSLYAGTIATALSC